MKTAGVILAGGKSSRMGRDKALLKIDGQTLLHRAQNILQQTGLTDIYVSRDDHIADIIPAHGPLSGIHAVACSIFTNYDKAIFLPIDMPKLTPALIAVLLNSDCDAQILRFQNHLFPFRMRLNTEIIDRLECLLQSKDSYSLNRFQVTFDYQELPLPKSAQENELLFENINTPAQYSNLQKVSVI